MARAPKSVAAWPWDKVDLSLAEISSIKAIASQHPLGYAAIVEKICRFNQMSFTAGGEDGRRATDYAEGKRGVAHTLHQIVAMKLPTRPNGPPPGDRPGSLAKPT